MSKNVFCLVSYLPTGYGYIMPIIVAVSPTRAQAAERQQRYLRQNGKVVNIEQRGINESCLVIDRGNATPPFILAGGRKAKAKDLEKAMRHLRALYPMANISIKQYCDTSLFQEYGAMDLEEVKNG